MSNCFLQHVENNCSLPWTSVNILRLYAFSKNISCIIIFFPSYLLVNSSRIPPPLLHPFTLNCLQGYQIKAGHLDPFLFIYWPISYSYMFRGFQCALRPSCINDYADFCVKINWFPNLSKIEIFQFRKLFKVRNEYLIWFNCSL